LNAEMEVSNVLLTAVEKLNWFYKL